MEPTPDFDLALYPFNHLDHVSRIEEPGPVGASCGGPRPDRVSLPSSWTGQTRGVAVGVLVRLDQQRETVTSETRVSFQAMRFDSALRFTY
jgi:hypothetical protein